MNEMLELVFRYYGLDWMTMMFGLLGMWLMASRDKRGFLVNGLACLCGVSVAVLSGQLGFVAYNLVLMGMMVKGFVEWGRKPASLAA